MWKKPALAGVFLLLATGCTQDATPEAIANATACEDAVAEVAAAMDGEAAPEELQPAFEDCVNLEDFSTFVEEDVPELLGDMDPEQFVREQCENAEELADTELCEAL